MHHLLPQQYAHILYRLLEQTPASQHEEAVAAFARLLRNHAVLKKTPRIIEEYRRLAHEKEGGREVSITTAHDLPPSVYNAVLAVFGKHTTAVSATDNSIIGGIVIRDGNTVYDASIKSQLEQLTSHVS